jgi:hypothetical protein
MMRQVVAGAIVAVLGTGVLGAQQPEPFIVTSLPPGGQGQTNAQTMLQELRQARDLQNARDEAAAREVVPLQLQVVVARYQGEKRVSSMPYLLSINSAPASNFPLSTATTGSLRMGTRIAVPSTATSEGKTTTTFEYRDIGTSIDAGATRRADGDFNLTVTVADSGVYPDDQKMPSASGLPVIRSFQSTNRLILKDGQTSQFTAAADRISGDTVRVEVTLRVQR